jgi:ribosomal protein S18 acetylase RimI-like enzyme
MRIEQIGDDAEARTQVLALADELDQRRYVERVYEHSDQTFLLGAFEDDACVGFLLLLIQVIGRDAGRPPILRDETPLREGYVEAFAVHSRYRRRGIGQRLQEHAMELSSARGCYQIRSRSPLTSPENYALKLKMGYAIHPSEENDSYFFIKRIEP